MEHWKRIKTYPNYEASDMGHIRELMPNGQYRMLKIQKNSKTGYCQVLIGHGVHGTKRRYVHRLVAEAFIGIIPDGYEIDHIDTVRDNNHVSNLRIVTRSQNHLNIITRRRYSDYAKCREYSLITRQKMREKRLNRKHTEQSIQLMRQIAHKLYRPVFQLSLDGTLIASYGSIKEASQTTGIDKNCIIGCCKGRTKTAHNFIWRYES